ncbi:MAG: hypothetical protein ACKV1O_02970, partial [Saprospiraceae bacterium]
LTLATTWIAYTSQKIKQIVLHAIAFENKEPVFFRTDQTWGRPYRDCCLRASDRWDYRQPQIDKKLPFSCRIRNNQGPDFPLSLNTSLI